MAKKLKNLGMRGVVAVGLVVAILIGIVIGATVPRGFAANNAAQTTGPKAGDQCNGSGALSMQEGWEMFAMSAGNSEGLYLKSSNPGACDITITVSCAITVVGADPQYDVDVFKPVETRGSNDTDPCPLVDPEVKGVYDATATHTYTISSPLITWTQSDGTEAQKKFVLGDTVRVDFYARHSYLVMAQPISNPLPGTNKVPGGTLEDNLVAGIAATHGSPVCQWYDVPADTNVVTVAFDANTIIGAAWSPVVHNDKDDTKDRYAELTVFRPDEDVLNVVEIHAKNYGVLPNRMMICGHAKEAGQGLVYMQVEP